MVIALLGQFLLGIYVTLYVPMASITGSGGSPIMGMGGGMMGGMGRAMSGATTLMAHMMLGWLLLVSAILTLVGALLANQRVAVTLAAAGLVAIAVAGYGGLEFMATGHDGYSFLMGTGFAAAVAAYAAEIYTLGRSPNRQPSRE